MKKILWLSIISAVALSGCSLLEQHNSADSNQYVYGTKSVYQPQESPENYSKVPQGYQLVYTELLARHGSRALSKPKYDDISLQIWQAAKAQNALTPLGKNLGAEIERMMAANEKMGYGNLSEVGKQEHMLMGERMAKRNQALLKHAIQKQQTIAVEYSGKDRAKDSGLAFIDGLESITPAITPLIDQPKKNKAQLYFHKQKANKYYQEYKHHDPQLREAIDQLLDRPKTHAVARDILERLYTPAYVDQLAAGKLSFLRKDKTKPTVYNDVAAALQLFNLYLIAPGLAEEAGNQPWRFKQYVTPQESQWLSYVLDGEDFYEKGPSFYDTDITYRMAKPLEDDFFNEIKGIQDGTNTKAAKLRFAHAETIIPFAAIMQLQGSTQGVSREDGYTLQDNPWRGAWVAPYSANIQWDVYRNDSGKLLVKMLYNEKEIGFKSDCKPMESNSYFYHFEELTRCYGE